MIKVSILVAVYNGEQFINKCLNSLKNQTYKNIEIICINDGSTDSTANIIKNRMIDDKRIKLFEHYPNKGLAITLNEGLDACTGDVIAYLDSDDWFDKDSVENLVEVFDSHEDADCVLLNCIYVYSNGKTEKYKGLNFESLDGMTAFKESLTWNIHGIYAARSELYRKFQFDDSCRYFSNDNTTRIHYYMSRRVYSSQANYYYLQNKNSITNQISISRMDYMRATQSMKSQLLKLNCPIDIISIYENERWKIVIDSYLFYFMNRSKLSLDERKFCQEELHKGMKDIDVNLIYNSLSNKFGFCPVKQSWTLFRIEEEIYFTLKKLFNKI